MAWFKRDPREHVGLIFHNVRRSQYASGDFKYGITASMSRKGNCWDRDPVRFVEGGAVAWTALRDATPGQGRGIAWVPWYNRTRLHSTLACISPVRFEQDWHAAQAKQVNS